VEDVMSEGIPELADPASGEMASEGTASLPAAGSFRY